MIEGNEAKIRGDTLAGLEAQAPEQLLAGRPRRFDDSYQEDELHYLQFMRNILRLLSVRSSPDLRRLVLTLPLRILNSGRVEAFVSGRTVYVDIALLDLLWLFSFEQGVGDIKRDPYHMLEFTINYADSLHSRKPFGQLDPYNSAPLSESQFRQLWDDARHVQWIAFENTLAFVLSHEAGHLVLEHEEEANRKFPDRASRRVDNAAWLLWRRQSELAADRFGARLCLDALYQPAQVIPWLDLVEVRRSYYGESAEYPTPGQRASTIGSAYAERFGRDGIDTSAMPKVDPLPPDRDMSKVDRVRNLDNVRRVRSFRRNFLAQLDYQVGEIVRKSQDASLAAASFMFQIRAYRGLLYGADQPEVIDEALARLDTVRNEQDDLVRILGDLFERAFTAPEPRALLTAHLESPIDVEGLRGLLTWARNGNRMFADALELGYLLANTRFRWEPEIFESMCAELPETERVRIRLAPHRIGEPARRPRFTAEERIEALQRWDGRYVEV